MGKLLSMIKRDKAMAIIAAVEAVILLILLYKAVIGKATYVSMAGDVFFDNIKGYDTITADDRDIVFNGVSDSIEDTLEGGETVYSSEFALRAGAYDVMVDYESEGGVLTEYVFDSNAYLGIRSTLKESTPKYEKIYLYDQEEQANGRLYIPAFSSLSDLQLFIHYSGPGLLRVRSISFLENKVYRFMQIIGYLICFLIFDIIYYFLFSALYRNSKIDPFTKGKERTVLIFSATVLIASLPLIMDFLYSGHDILFHLNRIGAIADAMRYHTLPVRIQSDLLNGFGYDIPLFYCDIFLYPAAFLYGFCMLPMRLCYQIYVLMMNIMTAYLSYRCFKIIFKDTDFATIGMVLYTLSIYRLVDIYLRASVGEYTALTFYPLVFEGIYRIYTQEKPILDDWIPLSLGMACIVQSHFMSTLMILFFILIFVLSSIRKLSLYRVSAFIKATLCGMALSVWFWLPMLQSLDELKPVVTDVSKRIQHTGLYLVQLFELLPSGYGISNDGTTGDMPLGLGGGMLAGVIAIVIYRLRRNKKKDFICDGQYEKLLNITFALGMLAVWMSTVYFPRDLIARQLVGKYKFIGSLWEVMELVWRHLAIAALLLDISIVSFLTLLQAKSRKLYRGLLITVILLSLVTDLSFYGDFAYNCPQYTYIEMNSDQRAFVDIYDDFDMVWGMNRKIKDDRVITDGTDIVVSEYGRDGSDRIIICRNEGKEGDVILPLFDYVHYHAYDEGSGEELVTVRSDENARLAVKVPYGFDGCIRVKYEEPVLWRIAEWVSLISWLMYVCFVMIRRIRRTV